MKLGTGGRASSKPVSQISDGTVDRLSGRRKKLWQEPPFSFSLRGGRRHYSISAEEDGAIYACAFQEDPLSCAHGQIGTVVKGTTHASNACRKFSLGSTREGLHVPPSDLGPEHPMKLQVSVPDRKPTSDTFRGWNLYGSFVGGGIFSLCIRGFPAWKYRWQ